MIELLGYAAVGYWAAKWFEPLQWVKDRFFDIFNTTVARMFNRPNFQFKYDYVLYCPKCVTFWGTLIYTQNIFDACISALLAYMITFTINQINNNWDE